MEQKLLAQGDVLGVPMRVLLWGVIVLTVAIGVRYGLLENGLLPRDCLAPGSPVAPCVFKTALVQSFLHERLGWGSLALGAISFMLGCRRAAWAGWLAGLLGLVLYSYEPAAVGAMLSVLVLARPQQRH
ncbi:hypothetical protein [Thauera sp. 2A1]|mgnify:CR=1 FL=1|uniref:hypothetical protein n=1 Tax=Thauera sp. 2A1 TaxID=2570191 RepID=UPI001D1746BE|nr:hypothetical protein [Thauera sp. 2A1]KAI5913840.1 hypothetical protein GH664_16355 [Thauera sp. 2A1]